MQRLLFLTFIFSLLLTANCEGKTIREKYSYDEVHSSSEGSFVKLSDGWTHYELIGSDTGRVAVLIHGGTIPMCIWDPQIEALTDAGIRVLRYDQFGKGLSDRPETMYSRELFKRQLTELFDSLKLTNPVDILGPSFGGTIAINYAESFPGRVRSIILISPVLNLLKSDSPLTGPLKMLRIPVIGDILFITAVRRKLIARGLSLVPKGHSPCDSMFIQQFQIKGTSKALMSVFRSDAYGSYIESATLVNKRINRILLIRGDGDGEVTPSMIQETRDCIPSCKYITLTNAGHSPGSEADGAERLNKIIVKYLTEEK